MPGLLKSVCKTYFKEFLVGRLWEGVVHNINSPLQIASMNLEILKMQKDSGSAFPEPIWERIEQITDSIDRIQHITNILVKRKEFGESGPTAVILEEIIRNELEFWIADLFFKHNIKKDVVLGEKASVVVVDAPMLIDLIDAVFALQISMMKHSQGQEHTFSIKKMEDHHEGVVSLVFDRSGPPFDMDPTGIECPETQDQEFFRLCTDVMYDAASRIGCKVHVKDASIVLVLPKSPRS